MSSTDERRHDNEHQPPIHPPRAPPPAVTDNDWTNSLPSHSSPPCEKEREHLESVCDSFRQYATFMRCARAGHAARVAALPAATQNLLPRWMLSGTTPESVERDKVMKEAELRNQFLFDSMLRHAGLPTSQDVIGNGGGGENGGVGGGSGSTEGGEVMKWSSDDMMDKVHSVLKSLSRDWSKEGVSERVMSYQPILNGIRQHIPSHTPGRHTIPRICVPGAGLGRLALEIYAMGYEVQGNEFSLHMLLASDFILNGCSAQRPFNISPWLASTKNVCRTPDPARSIPVPDVDPSGVVPGGSEESSVGELPDFSMAAGEFMSVYSKPEERGRWQGVASCFFLDTAPNIIDYLKVIYDMLDEGGIFVNFGPLLFHWSGPPVRPDDMSFDQYLEKHSHLDPRYLESIDMSWEDVRDAMWRVGFEILDQNVGVKARYTADLRSFMNSDYRCVYFVAKKTSRQNTPPPPSGNA
eukprot:CAMPEP_0172515712 /NCGR_PEP_ID=MMETSP1066-20121228/270010_1 /TAXON_ID=671091 /ORGANISM="Coscinodiscus wailesii, Strain CCMP2513" /LENGTH=466 /DNA_ID=CAMNT_0013296861 /DNA_START=268 /DNA_END=1668 /DNA_ORIENTATION=-